MIFRLFLALALLLAAAPAAATPSEDLMQLADAYWEGNLRFHPRTATNIGDHRYDALLDDNSPAGREAERAWMQNLLEQVEQIDASALSENDRVTRTALRFTLESDLARAACGMESWNVDPLGGPQVSLFNMPAVH